MLWLCICFPRLPFDALSLNDSALAVVTLTHKRSRRILVSSKAAAHLQLTTGMDFATAATLCANLNAIDRNSRAEHKALERLAAWAYQWSSFVTLQLADPKSLTEHSMLWLEIAASFKLFGGHAALLKRIENELAALNYEYQLGVACTLEGAALMARAQRRVIADTPTVLRRHLSKLSINLLALPDSVIFELQRAGIRAIETFIDLPRDAVARRFGPNVNTYLDKLLGIAADPRPAFQLPKKYRARYELGAEIINTEALLFPLRRMLGELQGYLRAIDSGVQRFILHLKHRQGSTRIAIGFSVPERNAERFFSLGRERLERVVLPAPVIEIGLQADHFSLPTTLQSELFANAQQSTEQFQQVLDKLTARLGDEAVKGFSLLADHRPEAAWTASNPGAISPTPTVTAPRPLWLLAQPRRIDAPNTSLNEPERIESGWWDGGDMQRDYYFVRAANGSGCWIYCDHRNDWYLHGVCG
ncbi:MAG: DNA polymerase Y family protein [Candidatus Obscuribacterales bacterium]|nr:DNA polymerase Y family protein [Steroidobacteraceae bacterium]